MAFQLNNCMIIFGQMLHLYIAFLMNFIMTINFNIL